jgi:hypothetical protein
VIKERFVRDRDATVEHFADGAVAATRGRVFRLNHSAFKVWELLESPKSIEDLRDQCAMIFGERPSAIEADVRALINHWLDIGLVRTL